MARAYGMVVCYVGDCIIWAAAGLYSGIVQLYQGLSWGILQVTWVGLHVIRPTSKFLALRDVDGDSWSDQETVLLLEGMHPYQPFWFIKYVE